MKKRWGSVDWSVVCYCSEGKPWYLRELLLRQKRARPGGPGVMGNTLIFWPENLDRPALYGCSAAGNIWREEVRRLVFPPQPADCPSAFSVFCIIFFSSTDTTGLGWRVDIGLNVTISSHWSRPTPGSNYHYTLIGASSQQPAPLGGRPMISFLTESLLPVTHWWWMFPYNQSG